jgi:hypothetical protein
VRRLILWALGSVLVGVASVVIVGLGALALTTPFHNPDDGANFAAIWGVFLGPPLAAVGVGVLARRRGLGGGAIGLGVLALVAGLVAPRLLVAVAVEIPPEPPPVPIPVETTDLPS